jgi:hypothetical protein
MSSRAAICQVVGALGRAVIACTADGGVLPGTEARGGAGVTWALGTSAAATGPALEALGGGGPTGLRVGCMAAAAGGCERGGAARWL